MSMPARAGLLLVLLCSGCAPTIGHWDNVRASAVPSHAIAEPAGTLAVLPFHDARPTLNEPMSYVSLLPLVLWETVCYERPERIRGFVSQDSYDFQASRDPAEATRCALERCGLFAHVRRQHHDDPQPAELYLQGTLHATTWRGTFLTYGVSVLSPLLWCVGLPVGSSLCRLEYSLQLLDAQGATLWEYAFADEQRTTQGLYYNLFDDTRAFGELMRQGLADAIAELATRRPWERAASRTSPAAPLLAG